MEITSEVRASKTERQRDRETAMQIAIMQPIPSDELMVGSRGYPQAAVMGP